MTNALKRTTDESIALITEVFGGHKCTQVTDGDVTTITCTLNPSPDLPPNVWKAISEASLPKMSINVACWCPHACPVHGGAGAAPGW